MPFYWHQLPNLRLKPSPELENGKNHMDACQLHFGELTEKYGKVVAINLVMATFAYEVFEDQASILNNYIIIVCVYRSIIKVPKGN